MKIVRLGGCWFDGLFSLLNLSGIFSSDSDADSFTSSSSLEDVVVVVVVVDDDVDAAVVAVDTADAVVDAGVAAALSDTCSQHNSNTKFPYQQLASPPPPC